MKYFSIFCVNYKSYRILTSYLQSIDKSGIAAKATATVDVFIADNTDADIEPIDTSEYAGIRNIRVFAFHENIGYFGAIRRMMQAVDTKTYDYIIISNVDMTMRADMLQKLADTVYPENTGWIAPAIISQANGHDLNPQAIHRYTAIKLKTMKWLYRLPMIYNVYVLTLHRLKRKKIQQCPAGRIYAGHGSFIILTGEYVSRCGIIDYPVFLYCEEIYLAEECLRHNLKVVYDPSIAVDDIGKVSTGKAKRSTYYRWNIEGLTYVTGRYFV